MLDIAIVGGGLSGLSLASRLLENQRDIALFESADRLGGRIYSCKPTYTPVSTDETVSSSNETAYQYDLGPSWVWPEMQPRIAKFIRHYDIDVFPQWLAGESLYHTDRLSAPQRYTDHQTYAAARRIKGGSLRLIDVLLKTIPAELLHTGHHLQELIDHQDHVELLFTTADKQLSIKARQVVLTLPPRVLVDTVKFSPQLDSRIETLMHNTPTWMAGHAKAVIHYQTPFWKEQRLSGSALSTYQGAALGEIFDASSADDGHAVLSGFFALPAALRKDYRNDLEALIIEQLTRLFGQPAAQPEEIHIKDWFDEPRTATQADEIPPASHPQYGHQWLQLDHWHDKLFFSGTETAPQFGGYLEGALESTDRVIKHLS